jgi:leader peptidase (prepilin peptidase)/N-methyltransferase
MQIDWLAAVAIPAFALLGGWLAALAIGAMTKRAVSVVGLSAACGAIGVWTFHVVFGTTSFLLSLCLAWGLLVLAAVDWLEYRLPDAVTWPLAAGGLVAAYLMPAASELGYFAVPAIGFLAHHTGNAAVAFIPAERVGEHALSAAIGYAAFRSIGLAYRYLRGREGLGLGDAKLVAAAGAWLGLGPLPYVVFVASVVGIVWLLVSATVGGRQALSQRIPFGVPLACATWIVWLYGPIAPGGIW